ncbi:MAG TPA: hypothetical protein PKW05_07135 [Anaerolineae bacterium]|nr:hypothetical protein [Anaerolineae bacterium]HQJ51534.1 hypothetical protein [Anaerolineae bacterium]
MAKTKAAVPASPVDTPADRLQARLDELKGRLDDLCHRLPAHSPPPSMIAQMEDLEDEIARLEQRLADHSEGAT